MRLWAFISLAAMLLSGCAPSSFGTAAGLQGIASAVESIGSAATGFKSNQSAVELNGANRDLAEAQAASMRGQNEETALDRERLNRERVVTAKLLREMSGTYHDPILVTLAEWVSAGGDPDFAFKYALSHVETDTRVKVLPQQAMTLDPPAQTALAQHPLAPSAFPPAPPQGKAKADGDKATNSIRPGTQVPDSSSGG